MIVWIDVAGMVLAERRGDYGRHALVLAKTQVLVHTEPSDAAARTVVVVDDVLSLIDGADSVA